MDLQSAFSSDSNEVWGCFMMSRVRMLNFSNNLWKFFQIYQYYTMALIPPPSGLCPCFSYFTFMKFHRPVVINISDMLSLWWIPIDGKVSRYLSVMELFHVFKITINLLNYMCAINKSVIGYRMDADFIITNTKAYHFRMKSLIYSY